MDHLLQIAHRFPELLPFDIDRGIVHQQLVLAAGEVGKDRLDVALCALVGPEIVGQLVAERNDAQELARARQLAAFAGIQLFDHSAEFRQIGPDAFIPVHGPNGAIEKPVGHAGRSHDFLAAHIGQLVDLLPEFGRIGFLRQQVGHESLNLFVELRLLLICDGNQPGRLVGGHRRNRVGRSELEIEGGLGRGFGAAGHICARFPFAVSRIRARNHPMTISTVLSL